MNHLFIESIKNDFLLLDVVTNNGRLLTYRIDLQDNLSIPPAPLGDIKRSKRVDNDVTTTVNKVVKTMLDIEKKVKSLKKSELHYFEPEQKIFHRFHFDKYRSLKGLVNWANRL